MAAIFLLENGRVAFLDLINVLFAFLFVSLCGLEAKIDTFLVFGGIWAAILNISNCSRVTKVHPADSERRHSQLSKSIKRKTIYKTYQFSLVFVLWWTF